MEGYRTYASLAIVLLGALGVGKYFSEGELERMVTTLIEIVGIGLAAYFRYQATKK